MRISILGLGLIGGSIALAARRDGWDVTAWTPDGDAPRRAAADGIAAATTLEDAVGGADLVVIAAPPLASLDLVDRLGRLDPAVLRPDVVVTDVTSTKAAIVARADEARLRFVGGHPMAGRETSGFDAADADLFVDRPWVIVPGTRPDPDAESSVEALARACGARIVRMTADEHDAAVALISHVPLVVSAALVESAAAAPAWPEAEPLAATGWASMTRLARGDPEMGAGILTTNAAGIADRLSDLATRLAAWSEDLRASDPAERVTRRLVAARGVLEAPSDRDEVSGDRA